MDSVKSSDMIQFWKESYVERKMGFMRTQFWPYYEFMGLAEIARHKTCQIDDLKLEALDDGKDPAEPLMSLDFRGNGQHPKLRESLGN